jgi:hypothetical protein
MLGLVPRSKYACSFEFRQEIHTIKAPPPEENCVYSKTIFHIHDSNILHYISYYTINSRYRQFVKITIVK